MKRVGTVCRSKEPGRCRPRHGQLNSYEEVVDAYIRDFRADAAAELQDFRDRDSLAEVISRAARCLTPDDRRHPHRGAGKGAKALGFPSRDTLAPTDLPAAFGRLRPYEVEDCLCIYKDALARIARRVLSQFDRRRGGSTSCSTCSPDFHPSRKPI